MMNGPNPNKPRYEWQKKGPDGRSVGRFPSKEVNEWNVKVLIPVKAVREMSARLFFSVNCGQFSGLVLE